MEFVKSVPNAQTIIKLNRFARSGSVVFFLSDFLDKCSALEHFGSVLKLREVDEKHKKNNFGYFLVCGIHDGERNGAALRRLKDRL